MYTKRIANNVKARGYVTISAYLRDLGLNRDSNLERKINEIYKKVLFGK